MDMQFSRGKQDDLGRHGLDRPSVQGRMARFMEPCILLLLTAERSHGYELMEKLGHFGFDGTSSDMATLYRTLRQLEEDNMVVSAWEEGSQGPPRECTNLRKTVAPSSESGSQLSVITETGSPSLSMPTVPIRMEE